MIFYGTLTKPCKIPKNGAVPVSENWKIERRGKGNCFRFWWSTYIKRCTSNYVMSRVKILSSPALCGWSGVFQFQGMISKTEESRVSKNISIKTWQWKSRFWFCSAFVYFADLKTIYFASCLCCSANCFNYKGPCRWF